MNLNLEDNILFIDQDDQAEEICQRQEVDSAQIKEEENMTANISNGIIDASILEISSAATQNETRKVKLPKLKFFITTIWSLILVVPQYVDIATDIILLIGYATNEMWGYFILTLIFIIMPFLVIWISSYEYFSAVRIILMPFVLIVS